MSLFLGWGFLTSPWTRSAAEFIVPLIVGVIALLIGVVLFLSSDEFRYRNADKVAEYNYQCILCGYKWSRRADEPLPQVTVRPDLIAQGEQGLEEERRRREEEYKHAGMWMKK